MKYEIIYTEHYALIVSDEKPDGFYYDTYLKDIRHTGGSEYGESSITKKIIAHIAHRPLTDAPILEGVPLLPEFSKEEDVKKLSLEMGLEYYVGGNYDFENGVRKGYNKAKETYNLTLTKLLDLYIEETGYGMDMWSKEENQTMSTISKIIQSLQQPKRPEYFETVCDCQECGANKTNLSLDMGCENKMAKTTNSQGQTELVGEYSYE